MDETHALTAQERKLLSLAGRGFRIDEHTIGCDRCMARIPYRDLKVGEDQHGAQTETDYKLYGDVILCRLCDAETKGVTDRAVFLIEREGGETRKLPEPTTYPPGTDIDVMLEAPIHGNAYSDGNLNIALLKYAVNEAHPINKRRAAIAKLDEIVGEPRPKGGDQEVVNQFMEQMKDWIDEIKADDGDATNKFFEAPEPFNPLAGTDDDVNGFIRENTDP